MKRTDPIHVAVAETSVIVRSGLISVLKRLPDIPVQPVEITSMLLCSMTDSNLLKGYDETVGLYDDIETLNKKLVDLMHIGAEDDNENEQETLSQREKEIICCVVRGMTNKETAEKLFLSIHTVITHRRNIARKLQIHSPAGLTIYAIVNKLVELSEVKMNL